MRCGLVGWRGWVGFVAGYFTALHGQLNASAERAERAATNDHTPNRQAIRGHVPVLPQQAHIRTAAARQIEDMARILSERVEDMFPAESALAEARQDETVREDLRRAERERGPKYKQRPSGIFVPAGMADEE